MLHVAVHAHAESVLTCSGNKGLCAQDDSHFIFASLWVTLKFSVSLNSPLPVIEAIVNEGTIGFCWLYLPIPTSLCTYSKDICSVVQIGNHEYSLNDVDRILALLC